MKAEISGGAENSTPHVPQIKIVHSSPPASERTMTPPRAKDPLMKRLIRWLYPDQRVANRHTMPPLIAFLGMVRSSKEYKIGDVSIAGFYMITEDRWIPGTAFPITLERTDDSSMGRTLTVKATVVRVGDDGVGFSFLSPAADESAEGDAASSTRVDLTKLAQFLKGLPLSEGGAPPLERAS